MFRIGPVAVVLLMACAAACVAQEPFSVDVTLEKGDGSGPVLSVAFSVAAQHYLYADQVSVEAEGATLEPLSIPPPKQKEDPFSGGKADVYDHDVVLSYRVRAADGAPLKARVRYQGCSPSLCFLPAVQEFEVTGREEQGTEEEQEAPPAPGGAVPPAAGWQTLAGDFTIAGKASGYLRKADFLDFLDRTDAGVEQVGAAGPGQRSIGLSILLFLLWGLALNLTPCVLPMIPINLAIIGAGAGSGPRSRGFLLGALYGAGMAVAYGALGVVVVLSGSMFGSLSASPWFNLAVAVLFVFLSLAMAGLFTLDFSRFQGRTPSVKSALGRVVAAPVLGAVAALLAGACVAPAVIIVLTLAVDFYNRGVTLGLLLPFLLGIGMALPWPLAGAGLSVLPRPGKWMEWVKYGFAILILGFALYYGHSAYTGFRWRSGTNRAAVAEAQARLMAEEGWLGSLAAGLEAAGNQGKPVFVDFWASWCKNCLAMEKTTFREPSVKRRMESYVKVKYRMEDPGEPEAARVREHFGIIGLPTYVVLRPGVRKGN